VAELAARNTLEQKMQVTHDAGAGTPFAVVALACAVERAAWILAQVLAMHHSTDV
jgi:hypothetical protein